jgi:hypothetical protein
MAQTTSSTAADEVVSDLPSPIRFLRPYQVEARYGLTQKFLAHARGRGNGPPFVKASAKLVLYAVEDLEQWLAARRRLSTSDPGPAAQRGQSLV